MKSYLLALAALTLSIAIPSYADTNTESAVEAGQSASCTLSADAEAKLAKELETILGSQEAGVADDHGFHPPVHAYWHCTAFPNHGGHEHGHDAYSHDYSTAYYQALYSCQHSHGSCHVHCHQDQH